jgi:hypothetical protein
MEPHPSRLSPPWEFQISVNYQLSTYFHRGGSLLATWDPRNLSHLMQPECLLSYSQEPAIGNLELVESDLHNLTNSLFSVLNIIFRFLLRSPKYGLSHSEFTIYIIYIYIYIYIYIVTWQITSPRFVGSSEFIAHSLLHLHNSQFHNCYHLQYHNYFSCCSHCHSLDTTQLVAAGLQRILNTGC